jgi:hypothetical protein
MAKRTTSVHRRGSAEFAREMNLGSHLLVFNDDEVIQLLRAAVECEDNQGVLESVTERRFPPP